MFPENATRLTERLGKPELIESLKTSGEFIKEGKTAAEQAMRAWYVQTREVAPCLATIEMEAVYARDFPFAFEPPRYRRGTLPLKPIEEGVVKNVKPINPARKPFIQDIAEFPDKYILEDRKSVV